MERLREMVDLYGAFAWWVLMALIMLCAFVGCLIGFRTAVVINAIGAVGSLLAMFIFAWQAWGEWLETKDN